MESKVLIQPLININQVAEGCTIHVLYVSILANWVFRHADHCCHMTLTNQIKIQGQTNNIKMHVSPFSRYLSGTESLKAGCQICLMQTVLVILTLQTCIKPSSKLNELYRKIGW